MESVEELDTLEVKLNEEFLKGGKSGMKKIEKTVKTKKNKFFIKKKLLNRTMMLKPSLIS